MVDIPLKITIGIPADSLPSPVSGPIKRIAHARNAADPSTQNTAWTAVPQLSLSLAGIGAANNVRFDFSGVCGHSASGLVQLALFRDGNLLDIGASAYPQSNADIVPLSCTWIDSTHGGGDHTYAVFWRVWSGTGYLGRRGDNQHIFGTPSLIVASEYAP
ncbi:hypothetical protein [Mesorhizobium sp. Pch-S]|uniref:hypothetical protein n=1 Tax=Mesorhizobium sp. Pch-S TaxID=2082387 RepID=UPI001010C707|nr:hypothetical protein [Mesorhizobium sp. Pch-S]